MKHSLFQSPIHHVVTSSESMAGTSSQGFGEEAESIYEGFEDAYVHFISPISRNELTQKFERLAATWEYNNSLLSSAEKMILLPEYQEIIGMGKAAIPFILEELKEKPDYWFWALKSITGEDPVDPQDRGNLKKMTNSWIEWGKEAEYI